MKLVTMVTMTLGRPGSYYRDTNITNFVLRELRLRFLVKCDLVLDTNNDLVALKFNKGYAHFTVACIQHVWWKLTAVIG